MARSQERSRRKPSGGRYKRLTKVLKQLAGIPTLTKIEKLRIKEKKAHGGNTKKCLLGANIINVQDPKTKKFKKAEAIKVLENPANRHYVRRNILTKGTIVETSLGKVKITSRPGQEGSMNGIIIK